MPKPALRPLRPRRIPVQQRAGATVEAILEAAVQVLLREGFQRLTTTRVAERAGVSVGSLYQYFPHKNALVASLVQGHLDRVAAAIERACSLSRHLPADRMVVALVQAYVAAKLERLDLSVALYRLPSGFGGPQQQVPSLLRARDAVSAMLRTAPDARVPQPDTAAFFLVTALTGPVQAVLQAGAAPPLVKALTSHLVAMGQGYLRPWTQAGRGPAGRGPAGVRRR